MLFYKYLGYIMKSKEHGTHFMRKCKERHIRCYHQYTFLRTSYLSIYTTLTIIYCLHLLQYHPSELNSWPLLKYLLLHVYTLVCVYMYMHTCMSNLHGLYIHVSRLTIWYWPVYAGTQPWRKMIPLLLAVTSHLCSSFRGRTRGKYLIEVRKKKSKGILNLEMFKKKRYISLFQWI